MNTVRLPLLLAGALFASGCSDADITSPDLRQTAPPGSISVMTWNVYVGADVDAIIAALVDGDPTNDLPTLLAQIDTLFLTDFSARAQAFADEIAARRPHAVGLQEISTFGIDLTPLGVPVDFELAFLPILEAALADRGLNYTVAASILNIDAQPIPGMIQLLDYDVLLVDDDRADVGFTIAQNFSVNLGPVAPGVELKRGYLVAGVDVDGEEYAVVSTHTEPNIFGIDLSLLRAGQATEIVTVLGQMGASSAIVMGDLNDWVDSPLYQVFAGAGFTDAWAELRPGAFGYTCCHLPSLSNQTNEFDERIDYVLVRGIGHPIAGLQGRIDRLGGVPGDRVVGPEYRIWPADHAGLFAEFVMPPAVGLRSE